MSTAVPNRGTVTDLWLHIEPGKLSALRTLNRNHYLIVLHPAGGLRTVLPPGLHLGIFTWMPIC